MSRLIAPFLVAMVSVLNVDLGHAGSVTETVQLPPTREPGRGAPGCGNPEARTTADETVETIGSSIDEAISEYTGGLRLVSAAFKVPAVSGWVKSRLGLNDGPSACATLCVAYPSKSQGDWFVDASDGSGSGRLRSTGKEFSIGWAKLDRVTHARTGDGNMVTCANVRHWSHDRHRNFLLKVNFRPKPTGWKFCNKVRGGKPAYVAYSVRDRGVWTTRGWRKIPYGKCRYLTKRLESRYVYYYAKVLSRIWAGSKPLCTHPTKKFYKAKRGSCPKGLKIYKYKKVDTGKKTHWTTNIIW